MAEKIVIRNTQSPGDYIVLTAAVRDLKRAYPERFEFIMDIPQPAVYQHNPHLASFQKRQGRQVVAKYPMIHKSNQQRLHFMWGFLDYLNDQLGTRAALTEFRPDLYLTDAEKAEPPGGVKKPYWVLASGGKRDFTAKWWDPGWWQMVVDAMRDRVQLVQVGGGSHVHPKLTGVTDLVSKTSFRDLMRLIYNAEGVLCIVTCLMHIAAAFNKPCVVISGGREPWWWEAYNKENRLVNLRKGMPDWQPPASDNFIEHKFLHTLGELDCCKSGGCWKSRVEGNRNLCKNIVRQNNRSLPKCLQLITPDKVVAAAEEYYSDGVLSWGQVSKTVDLNVGFKQPELPKPPQTRPFTSLAELQKAAKDSPNDLMIWTDGTFTVNSDLTVGLHQRLMNNVVGGVVYWSYVPPELIQQVQSAPWYKGKELENHPLDRTRKRSYYSKGVLAARGEVWQGLVLPETGKPHWQVCMGEAMRQQGVDLVDIGDLVKR